MECTFCGCFNLLFLFIVNFGFVFELVKGFWGWWFIFAVLFLGFLGLMLFSLCVFLRFMCVCFGNILCLVWFVLVNIVLYPNISLKTELINISSVVNFKL